MTPMFSVQQPKLFSRQLIRTTGHSWASVASPDYSRRTVARPTSASSVESRRCPSCLAPAGTRARDVLYRTSQGARPEDVKQDGQIRGRSRSFVNDPGWPGKPACTSRGFSSLSGDASGRHERLSPIRSIVASLSRRTPPRARRRLATPISAVVRSVIMPPELPLPRASARSRRRRAISRRGKRRAPGALGRGGRRKPGERGTSMR